MSLPSFVFALAFILLGWTTSHSITYTLMGLVAHDHHEWYMHGYLDVLKLGGGSGLVLAFGLALRSFFRHGSFGRWLHEGGIAGTRKQVALSTFLPAAAFVLIEHLERLVAGTGTSPSAQLLTVGVVVQLVVGLLCLALVRVTFHVAQRIITSIARGLLVRPDRQATSLALESVIFVRLLCPMADSKAGRAPPVSNVSF
ncbi:MAG: hypothetical protein M3246_07755 [Actinomycetota bacterium]|nr:hypothetical protein [Actinomycetota bacterium]